MLTPRFGLVISVTVLLVAGSAAAQRVTTRPVEAAPATGAYGAGNVGGTTSGIDTGLEAPSLGSSLPTFQTPVIVEQPQAAAPAAVAAIPAGSCTPVSADTCASDAARCLAADFVDDNFDVRWDDQGPYVYRYSPTYSDADEAAGQECAAELYWCLQPHC